MVLECVQGKVLGRPADKPSVVRLERRWLPARRCAGSAHRAVLVVALLEEHRRAVVTDAPYNA